MKKQIISLTLTVLISLSVSACSLFDKSSDKKDAGSHDSLLDSSGSSDDSFGNGGIPPVSDSGGSAVSSVDNEEISLYTITAADGRSWEITDQNTIGYVTGWLDKVKEKSGEYLLSEADYPMISEADGYVITPDAGIDSYYITTEIIDLSKYGGKEYKHQKNFVSSEGVCELPWGYIDEISQILKNTDPDGGDKTQKTDEKVYTIKSGYLSSWEITDLSIIDEIDKWLEKVSAVRGDYVLNVESLDDLGAGGPPCSVMTGNCIDGTVNIDIYDPEDMGSFDYDEIVKKNFSVNGKYFKLPRDYIDEILAIIENSKPQDKTYTITAGYENSWDITDKEIIADIDSWLEKTDKMLDDCALEEGDYPDGAVEGIIIKTDGDNYEKMYFITTTRLDLTQYTEKKYEHQENFAVNQKAYELPWEHIDIITEIIENSKP